MSWLATNTLSVCGVTVPGVLCVYRSEACTRQQTASRAMLAFLVRNNDIKSRSL